MTDPAGPTAGHPSPARRASSGGDRAAARRCRIAVTSVFVLNGLVFAAWVSRIPAVRDHLELSTARVGLVLLSMSLGAVLALPSTGAVVPRIGAAGTVRAAAVVCTLGLALTGVAGGVAGGVPLLVVGLFLMGFGSGSWDVAMNVEGAEVERRLGRSVMPQFHGAWSIGSVTGAGLGTWLNYAGLPTVVHLVGTAVVVVVLAQVSCAWFLPASGEPEKHGGVRRRSPFAAWLEPRTVAIGFLVLAFAFTEGTANDWLALAVVDGYGVRNAIGVLTFTLFTVAMTVGRMLGTRLLDRFGRVLVLRTLALVALSGLLLVVVGGSVPVAMAGALLWGAGASLGFPVGMSAAAHDPAHAAARVSVVASIGYTAFLAGPPVIGFLAEHVGTLESLWVVLVVLVLGFVAAGAAREDAEGSTRPDRRRRAGDYAPDVPYPPPIADVQGRVPLADLTTSRVGGAAGRFVRATTTDELVDAVREVDDADEPLLLVAGGSNLLVADAPVPGTVVQVATTGVTVESVDDCAGAVVRVAAGEVWDDLVASAVGEGWAGIESLSGIPGSAGATPVQNVGAYGQEVAQTIASVRVWDRLGQRVHTVANADCRFSYRHSVFKASARHDVELGGCGRYVVLDVTFQLRLGHLSEPIAYADLASELGVGLGIRVPLADVRAAVLALRRRRGMVLDADDHDTWSTGSFFTNPLLSPEAFDRLAERLADRLGPDVTPPRFAARGPDGEPLVKTSAAWLIERAGFDRGYGLPGAAAISTKHTLAITNRGDATADDLLALARRVRDGVEQAFGVRLVNEPVLVGCSL